MMELFAVVVHHTPWSAAAKWSCAEMCPAAHLVAAKQFQGVVETPVAVASVIEQAVSAAAGKGIVG
jgi:hypothetical protein